MAASIVAYASLIGSSAERFVKRLKINGNSRGSCLRYISTHILLYDLYQGSLDTEVAAHSLDHVRLIEVARISCYRLENLFCNHAYGPSIFTQRYPFATNSLTGIRDEHPIRGKYSAQVVHITPTQNHFGCVTTSGVLRSVLP